MSGFIFSCSPSEAIEETTVQFSQTQEQSSSNSQTVSSEKFIYKGKQISLADYEKLGEETVSIVGMKDSTDTQYVFENRKEALVWLEQFGEKAKELSLGLTVSGILAKFAEENNIEAKFEATGEIPKEYLEFQSKTYIKYYGFDLSQDGSATGRTEGMGYIYDGCFYDGTSGLVPGPRAVLWFLDRKISSYDIVFVSWLAFHDRMFFRGKTLAFGLHPRNYTVSFCYAYTSWNNRARSITTFVLL